MLETKNQMTKQEPIAKDGISLKEVFQIIKEWYLYLLSKWKTLLLAGVFGAILGITYSFIKKPIYTASLSFVVEDEKSTGGLSGALGLASQFGLDLGGSNSSVFSGANLIELFKSRSMVEKTLLMPIKVKGKTISLAEMFIQNIKWRESWAEEPEFTNIQFLPNAKRENFTRVQDSILGKIYEILSKGSLSVAQKDKKIAIISIDMKSTNELFAKSFCESLAKKVSDFYIDSKSKKARINMDVLERQTDSIRKELNGAIKGVAVANDNVIGLNPSLNVRKTPSARRQVDVQANTAILTELVKQTELAKVTLRKDTPLIEIIDKPILPLPKERFGKIKGIVFGGFLIGFLTGFVIIVRRLYNQIMGG